MPTTPESIRMHSKVPIWRRLSQQATNELLEALHAHAGLVIRTAGAVLGNVADAEDVAQDIAEKLLRTPPGDVRHWPALLKTMAVNRAIDKLRARRDTDSDFSIADMPSNRPQPEELLAANEKACALRRAIAALKHRDATLFSLRYFADQSHANIATQMKMTENAVGVAMHRVRQQLADYIREDLKLAEKGGIDQ